MPRASRSVQHVVPAVTVAASSGPPVPERAVPAEVVVLRERMAMANDWMRHAVKVDDRKYEFWRGYWTALNELVTEAEESTAIGGNDEALRLRGGKEGA